MIPLTLFLCFLGSLPDPCTRTEAGLSYLYQPAFAIDYVLRQPAEPYCPQPGDLFLATGREMWAKFGHWAAFSGAPQHAGIVFAWPDGRLAVLEAGPHNTLHCRAAELIPQLDSYACFERVWIRRRRIPLTPEQSDALTAFCMSKEGARFALLRLFGQLTPFRSRGPLRTYFLGCSHNDQFGYFCAELTMQACVAAGLVDPATARPAATYPRDIFFGRSRNPFLNKHLCLCDWDPPARWTLCPDTETTFNRHFPRMDGDDEVK